MSIPTHYSFTRYLAAKKSVDDRALNQHVWNSLSAKLPAASAEAPLAVLEVGAGIGTMVERLVERGLLTQAVYTAIDVDRESIAESRRRLPAWMAAQGFCVRQDASGWSHYRRQDQHIVAAAEAIDLQGFIRRTQNRHSWDLLIAHALLDVLDIPHALPGLRALVKPGGLLYSTIVFDGATILEPAIDPGFDVHIETLYHQTMDQRLIANQPSGDSRTGRHLFHYLRAAGIELLDAGGSDWVIFAGPHGYPGDEAYFLHHIIHTIDLALRDHPQVEARRFAAWIERRHAQIEEGCLVYIAHQLDFLGRVPASLFSGMSSFARREER
jgi:SAM-dependent methyltransferase